MISPRQAPALTEIHCHFRENNFCFAEHQNQSLYPNNIIHHFAFTWLHNKKFPRYLNHCINRFILLFTDRKLLRYGGALCFRETSDARTRHRVWRRAEKTRSDWVTSSCQTALCQLQTETWLHLCSPDYQTTWVNTTSSSEANRGGCSPPKCRL